VLASTSQYERRLIGVRTREALQAARARRVRLGRRSGVAESTQARIVDLRGQGLSFRAVASVLDTEGHPTGQGAPMWSGASVRAVWLRARDAEDAA